MADTEPARLRDLHRLVAALGATPVAIDAGAHDRLVALTSHLPHVLANLLVVQAGAARIDGHDPLAAVGGSFRDMTRVAGANPRIWVDIFLDNREALAAALREHRRALDEVLAALEAGDAGYLARWIGQASGHRRRALAGAFDRRPEELYRVQVHVPDRPGVISGITQALGAARINIEDFELHHFTPERGGTIELLVAGARRRRARRRAARRAGLRRDRRAGAGGRRRERRDRSRPPRGRARRGARRRARRCPGDKSVSHRSLLLGAVCDGRVRGQRASAPTPTRSRRWPRSRRSARASSGSTRRRTRLRVHGVGLRGLKEPDGADRRAQLRHAAAPAAGPARRPERVASRSTATSRSAAGRSTASRCRCG